VHLERKLQQIETPLNCALKFSSQSHQKLATAQQRVVIGASVKATSPAAITIA
jgi:hypothetical protein